MMETCRNCAWHPTCVRKDLSRTDANCGYWEPEPGCDGECQRCPERPTCPGWDDLQQNDVDYEPMSERSTE